jgi:hypothetical protein
MWLKKLPRHLVGPILVVYALLYAAGLAVSVALLLGYHL